MFTPTEVECLTRALDPAAAPEVWKPAARELIAALRARAATVEDLTGDVPGELGPGEPVMPWGTHRNRSLGLVDRSYLDRTLKWLQEDGARRRKVTDLIANIESARDARVHTAASRTIGVASLGAGGEEGATHDAVARILTMTFVMLHYDTAVPCTMRLTARNPHVTVATLPFATLAAGLYGLLMRSRSVPTASTTPFRGRDGRRR